MADNASTTTSNAAPSIGYELLQQPALAGDHDARIHAMERDGFTFVVAPVQAQGAPGAAGVNANVSAADLRAPLDRTELVIQGPDFATVTVATVPTMFDTATVKDEVLRNKASLHFRRLVHWTGHLGVSAVQVPLPSDATAIPEFARQLLAHAIPLLPYSALWVRVPLGDADAWSRWNLARTLTGHHVKLQVLLDIGADLPDGPTDCTLARWRGEPLAAISLRTSAFLTNKKGYPVLSKAHQALVRPILVRNPHVIVSHDGAQRDLAAYQQYVAFLFRSQPAPSVIDQFAAGYHDYLQNPLQPLMDNLEAQTYEVFERDPVKYAQYQEATRKCLVDRGPQPQVVMVVGAGPRGPLVDCVLRASAEAEVAVKVYAVEKNANALVSLRHKQRSVWGDQVEVVFADMRTWQAPEPCDILVSELLGSFGDNELSPECLDGVQHVLKPDGVSIPHSYTPFWAPVSSSKLWTEASAAKTVAALETPYVVMIRDATVLADPQPVWTFTHPVPVATMQPENAHNERYSMTEFTMRDEALVHGMAGYFECVLYKDVLLSTVPATHSKDMTSWFPIYFPVRFPIAVPKGARVQAHLWRATGSHKVWHEWSVVPLAAPAADGHASEPARMPAGYASLIHNAGGRSYGIGL
ncbi:Protein arginine N-methyltransferase 5 [Allomyces arbusculus]|nr:Protein arginine N-methyltransferase 5 [Allomyces arbusculus]